MRIIRQKAFSAQRVLEDVTSKLDREGVREYEVSYSIPRDCISLNPDPNDLTIYLPVDLEYSQFGIDAFIRSMIPYARTSTTMDRNIYIMKIHGRLTTAQLVKLVKYIIKDSDFCVILKLESKLFSEDEEKKGTGKKVAKGVGSVTAGLGLGYLAVNEEKKHLTKKLREQEDLVQKGIKDCDEFTRRNFEGAKNKIKNAINPRRQDVLLKREADLWERGADKAAKEVIGIREKINRADKILEAPGKILSKLKEGAGKVGESVSKGAKKLQSKRRSAAFMKTGKPRRRIVKR